ncbi:MAG TPA: SufE family protein [Acidimicrobiales bacterium]|jgi:cysteine desulfuration protein SufE|nr:SufE family protein [Acidimicrobiales bacterium]
MSTDTSGPSPAAAPPALQRIVDLFGGAPKELRLQALLEYSKKVPPLPEELAGHRELMEQVPECATPFFLSTDVDDQDRVHLHFDVPDQAPTTRGFAGILHSGLEGATTEEVLSTPNDFYMKMGLAEAISAQRLRGMGAILGRLKRQVSAHVAAREAAQN